MIWERAYLSTNRFVPKSANMMTTFDSIKESVQEFFCDLHYGKLKLSEYQRDGVETS